MPTAKQKKLRAERETAKRRRLHGRKAQPQRGDESPFKTLVIGGEGDEPGIVIHPAHLDALKDFQPVGYGTPDGVWHEFKGNPPSIEAHADGVVLGAPTASYVAVPTRSKCPSCGFSHKVRKDGTMSRHDVYYGDQPTQCEGTGQPWDAAASSA